LVCCPLPLRTLIAGDHPRESACGPSLWVQLYAGPQKHPLHFADALRSAHMRTAVLVVEYGNWRIQ
jgi:hypothetical protein